MRIAQENAVRAFYLSYAPAGVRALIADARMDLHYGPLDADQADSEHWTGFEDACIAIADAFEFSDLWIDDCEFITDSEPIWCEGCDECDSESHEYPDRWTRIDVRDVRRAVLGELADYV